MLEALSVEECARSFSRPGRDAADTAPAGGRGRASHRSPQYLCTYQRIGLGRRPRRMPVEQPQHPVAPGLDSWALIGRRDCRQTGRGPDEPSRPFGPQAPCRPFRRTLSVAGPSPNERHVRIRMAHLETGDYLINDEVVVERKSGLRFRCLSGRWTRISAGGSTCSQLLPMPPPHRRPDAHIHPECSRPLHRRGARLDRRNVAPSGASPAGSEQSVRLLRFLAEQAGGPHERVLRRFDRKPKRLASRRLFLLQGCRVSAPLSHIGSSFTLVASSGCSPLMRPPWLRSEVSARRRRRASGRLLR
jgi:hypothetical protein